MTDTFKSLRETLKRWKRKERTSCLVFSLTPGRSLTPPERLNSAPVLDCWGQMSKPLHMGRPACLTCDDVPAAGAAHLLLAGLRVVRLQQADHLGVVGDGGAVAGGAEGDGEVHAGVVVLP